jgi:transcription elongation factor Elf1
MPETIMFACPRCGCEKLQVSSSPKRIEDFEGATCAECGYTITVDDIKNKAIDIAKDTLKNSMHSIFKR